jgi:hypothetical protein
LIVLFLWLRRPTLCENLRSLPRDYGQATFDGRGLFFFCVFSVFRGLNLVLSLLQEKAIEDAYSTFWKISDVRSVFRLNFVSTHNPQ